MMKVLIIDDERIARKELIRLLDPYPEVEEIVELESGQEGITYLESNKVDLMFLDIQMPGMDGFEMLTSLDSAPKVIFVTAYDEYAIKAFEFSALDYLLKPVDERRFAEAMQKFLQSYEPEKKSPENEEELSLEDQVFVKDGDKCWFVRLGDVALFESEGNYVRVYFDEHKPLILRSLNNLEKRLDHKKFFRANRKFIINLNWVDNIESWFNGGLMVHLKNGKQIEISRRQSSKLKDMMSL
jgi:two-component system LytT family response regulator